MKKKNASMFKILAIMIFVLALLSWVIPASNYNDMTLMTKEISRVSIFDIFLYPSTVVLQQVEFIRPILFILAIGGMYGVLSKTGKYRNQLEKIAKSMKGKEELFLIGVSLIFATLISVFGFNPLILLIIIPAICSIISLMGYNKITILLVAFLSPLIGIIGNTYGGNYVNYINQILETTFKTELIFKIALFVISYVIYIFFTITYARKHKIDKKEENEKAEEEILFLGEKKQNKKASWPIFVILGLLLVLSILGHTNWTESFNTEFFTDLHEAITKFSVWDHTIIAYLINDISPFGNWMYAESTVLVIIASIIITYVYNLKGEGLKAFSEGVLKVLKPIAIIILAYTVLLMTVFHPYFMTVTSWSMDLIKNVTGPLGEILFVLFASLNTIISTTLNIDLLFVLTGTIKYITADAPNVLAIITQSMHGITLFLAPTSIMLLLGIEYLNISYKEWIKAAWKLILELFIIAIIIILIVTFI